MELCGAEVDAGHVERHVHSSRFMTPRMKICAAVLAGLALASCQEQQLKPDGTRAEYTTVEGKRIEVRVQATNVANEYRLIAVRDTIVVNPDPANERRRDMQAAKPFMKRTCKGSTTEILEEGLVDNIILRALQVRGVEFRLIGEWMPKVGYLLPTRERVMEGRHETASLLALAERAEALGFDSVWVGDSVLARPRHDSLTLLAAVAARTRKVELGTAVLLPALRNPVLLAHQVATLDRIAEGRVILGVGIASDWPNIRAEFEATGVPFEKRIGRLIEGLALCRALWTVEAVTWDGRWKMKDV